MGAGISKAAEARSFIDAVIKACGPLDILVNNAGLCEFAPLEDVTEESFHKLFNVKVLELLLVTRAAAKKMGDGGEIINIGSGVSRAKPVTAVVYAVCQKSVPK